MVEAIIVKFISEVSKPNGQHVNILQDVNSKNIIIDLNYFDERIADIQISKEEAIKIANDILSKINEDEIG